METSLEVGLMVIARGKLAFITKVLPNAQFEVLNKKDRLSCVVAIDEIEPIDTINSTDRPPSQLTGQLVREFNAAAVDSELASVRFQIIKKYRENKITVAQAAAELKVSPPRIYQLAKKFDESIGVISVLSAKKGRKVGSVASSDLMEGYIKQCIKKHFKGKKASARKVYRELQQLCFDKSIEPPSFSTVRRRILSLSPFEKAKAVHGAEYARDTLGLKSGKTSVDRPLQRVQIDHTLVDVFVIDEVTGKEPIRPWLTMVIDTYTRVILGFYLSLDAPSAIAIAASLTMACIPKTDYLKLIGVESVSYPFYGKPELVHVDNAAEFRSPKFVKALSMNNIKVEWRPIGKKHWGGIVERLIGTFMGMVHFLPGTTYSNTQQRKGTPADKDAALTFPRLLNWFTLQVEQYHNTEHNGLKRRSPANIWYESLKDDSGRLRYPPIINDVFKFRLSFMPEVSRSITSRGIQFNRQYYSSPALSVYVGRRKVPIKYDPYRMKKIWAYLDGEFVEATYDITKPDMTLDELNQFDRYHPEPWLSTEKSFQIKKEADKIIKASLKQQRKKRAYSLANQMFLPPAVQLEQDETNSMQEDFIPRPFKVEE